MSGYINEISEILAEVSLGNLNVDISSEYKGDFKENKNFINNIIVSFNATIKEIIYASDEVTVGSHQVSDGSQQLSQGTAEQASAIDEIAFQTNSLSLNAAIEAARSGQAGKEFAVVAEDVRNLASMSAKAAQDTNSLIESTISKSEIGMKITKGTAGALDKIVAGAEKAAALVSEISIASNEQATGIAQINKGVEQVSMVVQSNSATAEESAASSEELSIKSELLKEKVSKFRLKV